MITCDEFAGLMIEDDQDLTPESRKELNRHKAECEDCARLFAGYATYKRAVRISNVRPGDSPRVHETIVALAKKSIAEGTNRRKKAVASGSVESTEAPAPRPMESVVEKTTEKKEPEEKQVVKETEKPEETKGKKKRWPRPPKTPFFLFAVASAGYLALAGAGTVPAVSLPLLASRGVTPHLPDALLRPNEKAFPCKPAYPEEYASGPFFPGSTGTLSLPGVDAERFLQKALEDDAAVNSSTINSSTRTKKP